MIADLILADFKSKTWISDRSRKEQDLQRQGEALILHALRGAPQVPIGNEPTIVIDTECSEMNPDAAS